MHGRSTTKRTTSSTPYTSPAKNGKRAKTADTLDIPSSFTCKGCGITVSALNGVMLQCPNASCQPTIDHWLMPAPVSLEQTMKFAEGAKIDETNPAGQNPFIKFRALLFPYRVAIRMGFSDEEYIKIVEDLNSELEKLGNGFVETPLILPKAEEPNMLVKNETDNVAQSFKSRHLFCVMLYLLIKEKKNPNEPRRRLAVASCGNAGLAAATVARAANWPIDVCVPPDAKQAVVDKLNAVGANIIFCCESKDVSGKVGEAACGDDPCLLAMQSLVKDANGLAFSVQGTECGLAVEGGQTLIWETMEALRRDPEQLKTAIDALYIQVGGGALASSLYMGFQRVVSGELGAAMKLPRGYTYNMSQCPRLFCSEPEGCAPLHVHHNKCKQAAAGEKIEGSTKQMASWKGQAHSIAYGLLDNKVYDWVTLVKGMDDTKGDSLSVPDEWIAKAKAKATEVWPEVSPCHSAVTGLGGHLMRVNQGGDVGRTLFVFSGFDRECTQKSDDVNMPDAQVVVNPNYFSSDGKFYRSLNNKSEDIPVTPDLLHAFNKTHGTSPYNHIPDDECKAHFTTVLASDGLAGGAAAYGAYTLRDGKRVLVGLISVEKNEEYWAANERDQKAPSFFVHEFVVAPETRGTGIGTKMIAFLLKALREFAGEKGGICCYTTVHADNMASRRAFERAGFHEVMTYADGERGRNTTVLKWTKNVVSGTAKKLTRVVGVQSGNAVDGIDVAVVDFEPVVRSTSDSRALGAPIKYKCLGFRTYPFTSEQRNKVLALRAGTMQCKDYAKATYELSAWFADAVTECLKEMDIDKSTVDWVSSHGQTITGHPHMEMGDLSVMAQRCGLDCVGDFRPADVAAGGNGTPVTCTYDSIMLRPAPGSPWRVAINIGGTSSVTFCPPWEKEGEPIQLTHGLDPGLGVFFMDLTAKHCIDSKLDYDPEGSIARTGTINEKFLNEVLLQYKYYQQEKLPIGVGPEDFSEKLWAEWRDLAFSPKYGLSPKDLLATFTELTARQIAIACSKHGGPNIVGNTGDVILRGQVVKNLFFVERLRWNMEKELNCAVPRLVTLDQLGLDEESWEGAMYAMMGYLCVNGCYNFQPNCTGASRPVVGGMMVRSSVKDIQ